MKISRLQAQNFKSFDSVDVELGDLNVFIGANASGKSNFLSILSFLRDTIRYGLEDAVSLHGDVEFLRNNSIGERKSTKISFFSEKYERVSDNLISSIDRERIKGVRYELSIKYDGLDFFVNGENIDKFLKEDYENKGLYPIHEEDAKMVSISRDGDRVQRKKLEDGKLVDSDINIPELTSGTSKYSPKESLLGSTEFSSFAFGVTMHSNFKPIGLYDLDVNQQKSVSPISGVKRLNEDGSNVALVLSNILKDEENRRKFINLSKSLLPFVENLNVDRFAGQSLLVKIQESYAGDYLPASLLSDGTVKIVALLIALYFEDIPVNAFEEPATSLHPKLISQLMQMMKEVSEDKQIFITTHNPEVIKHVDLDDVYLVSRDEEGFSQISKPADKEEVRVFLENDLGIDDLFVQNLL